ncbi:MAG: hypothetical protein AAGB19_19055 [Cyanobacteria bacterium P01_F01_bin.3]
METVLTSTVPPSRGRDTNDTFYSRVQVTQVQAQFINQGVRMIRSNQ